MRLLFACVCLLATTTLAPAFAQSRKELMAEYARRYKAIDKKSVDQMVELARWCQDKKLKTYANLLFKKVLKLDPNHAIANAAKGNVKIGDRWYTKADATKARERLAAAKAAAAAKAKATANRKLTELPDEPSARAKVTRDLAKNSDRAARLLEAATQALGTGCAAAVSEHATIVAKAPQEDVQRYAQIAEYVYRRLSWITFGKLDARPFRRDGNRHLFYLAAPDLAGTALRLVAKQHPGVADRNDVAGIAKVVDASKLEFTTFHAPPCLVLYRKETRTSAVANQMACSFVNHFAKAWYRELDVKRGKLKDFSMLKWLQEGAGIWASLMATGRNEIYRISSRYARRFEKDEDEPPFYAGMAYAIVTTGKTGKSSARAFYQLCRARPSSWNDADLAMSFALVDYLIRARTRDWRGLFERLPQAESFRVAFIQQFGTREETANAGRAVEEADDTRLSAIFRPVAGRLESQWKAWVKKEYAAIRDKPRWYLDNAPFPDIR